MKGQKQLPQPNVTAETLREAKLRNSMTDMVRGGLLGATTDAVGYIPDAVADFMRPFGYNVPPQDVIGGTEWLANKFTTPTNSRTENIARFATGMLTPSITDIARLGKGPMSEMTVYHGSPHDFDKFDMSKIGTGEGAQAYGHGLYVAESPGVAKQYKEKLSVNASWPMSGYNTAVKMDPQLVADLESVLGKGDDVRINRAIIKPTEFREIDAKLKARINAFKKGARGHIYEVDLPDSHIANMLDWDAPLSQQPENVRAAFKRRITEPKAIDGMDMGGNARLRDNRNRQADPSQVQPWVLETTGANGVSRFGLSQKDVDRLIGGQDVSQLTGAQIYQRMAAEQGGFPQASEFMRSLGIPGIKYLDGGSRAAGDGSRNYVVFDDKLLKILKKE